MDIVDPAVDRYLHELANPRDPVLREMEVLAAELNFPIVGPAVGQLLFVIAKAIRARRVIELGSGFGYSAYWFARAMEPGSTVILTEGDEQRAANAADFLARGGLDGRVRIEVGNGLDIIDRIGGEFDIVFNDIDKKDYPLVLDKAAAALRPGGLLICDNMLWFGTVLDDESDDPPTRGIRELTRRLYASDEFDTVLIPIRDGVTVSTYRS
jgi:predicted O-methyltransferase YrrM